MAFSLYKPNKENQEQYTYEEQYTYVTRYFHFHSKSIDWFLYEGNTGT